MLPEKPPRRRILVAVDATKDQLSSEAIDWTLQHVAQPGDTLRLLGILTQVPTLQMKLRHKSKVDSSGIDEIEKIFVTNKDYFEQVQRLCENRQVDLSTAIIPGTPARAVLLLDVNTFNPSWIVLDRFMKKERKHLCEQLHCSLAIMDKHGRGEVKKLVSSPAELDSYVSELFELDGPMGFSPCNSCVNASATETSCTSVEFSNVLTPSCDENSCTSVEFSSRNATFCTSVEFSTTATPSCNENFCPSVEFSSVTPSCNDMNPYPNSVDNENKLIHGGETSMGNSAADHINQNVRTTMKATGTPEVVSRQSSNVVPISVRPKRVSEMEVLELLGGGSELETDLFDSFVEGTESFRMFHSDVQGTESLKKPEMKQISSIEKLDRYFSVDENHGDFKPQSGNQGANPLCSQCNNKSPRFGTQPTSFPYSQIEEATNHFSKENLVAEGGFGLVFKGVLPDGQLVAVKQHKLASRQGDREFRAEVEVLSSAQHRNLVTLIGYCNEGGRRILVYEYVCNGSLHWHLSPKNLKPLDWPSRQKIALGAARGLRYLHEECRIGCIVHRDVRPNNILVTHDFTALVGDFGLARWQAKGDTAEQTRVIGTIGYVAPEYAETGQITEKADVYSFGLVLLEIITGLAAFDGYRQTGEQHLADWASPLLAARATHELLDKRIDESTVDEYELINMVTAANLCIQKDPGKRPKMSQVVRHLEGDDRESAPLSPIELERSSSSSSRLSTAARPSSVSGRPSTSSSSLMREKKMFSADKLTRKRSNTKDELKKKPISYHEML